MYPENKMLVAALILTLLTAKSEAHVSWADQPLPHPHLDGKEFPKDGGFHFAPLSPLGKLVEFARTYCLATAGSFAKDPLGLWSSPTSRFWEPHFLSTRRTMLIMNLLITDGLFLR